MHTHIYIYIYNVYTHNLSYKFMSFLRVKKVRLRKGSLYVVLVFLSLVCCFAWLHEEEEKQ